MTRAHHNSEGLQNTVFDQISALLFTCFKLLLPLFKTVDPDQLASYEASRSGPTRFHTRDESILVYLSHGLTLLKCLDICSYSFV